ncbi:MAG: efflux RND transporter periplasmic adaptor subunit, partial [Bacteroidales bacterium]
LYDKGVIPAQKRDEAEANWKSMQTSEKTAYAQYSMAQQGAEKEDKLLAEALVQKSQGGLNEVNAYLEEGILLSPIDGEIAEIFPHQGELVGTGAPIMNIVDLKDLWVVFHVRENLLNDMKIGAPLSAFIPALGDREVHLTVTYLKDMGSYATWKATKTNGQYDAKTFEVRAKPNQPIKDLRPGMSVILKKK